MEEEDFYEKVIYEDSDKFLQVHVTVSQFRGVEYFSMRKYYLDFEGDWKPTKEGITIPLNLVSTGLLFEALVEILSLAESKEQIRKHFSGILKDIYPDE
jgi:hypothetical protein